MKSLRAALFVGAAVIVAASVLVGCHRHRETRDVVYADPPPTETAAGALPPGPVVVAQDPPPDPIVEVVPAPRSGYVWIGGYWFWSGGRYAWVRGHFVVPPSGYERARWVEPRWEHGSRGWEHYQGHFEQSGEHREEHQGR
jgi:hypothetical protein